MKETNKETVVRLSAFSEETGEVFPVSGSIVESSKYYNIKNLNKRICIMDLFTAQSKICNSSKAIEIFRDILYETRKDNVFDKNITKFAKSNGHSRQQVTSILLKFIKNDLAIRIDRGVYIVNPFSFQSKGSTNELIEKAQIEWNNKAMLNDETE